MPYTRKDRTTKSNQGQAVPVVDWQELETFRMTLPEYHQHEPFRFLVWQWGIVKALDLLQKYPRPAGRLKVSGAARVCGLDKPIELPETREDGTVILHDSAAVAIDPVFAMSDRIDRERPVILALVQFPGSVRATLLLIDGFHRLYRAAQDGQEAIPCYVLIPEEEQVCRLSCFRSVYVYITVFRKTSVSAKTRELCKASLPSRQRH